jgi:hypothetical protein
MSFNDSDKQGVASFSFLFSLKTLTLERNKLHVQIIHTVINWIIEKRLRNQHTHVEQDWKGSNNLAPIVLHSPSLQKQF